MQSRNHDEHLMGRSGSDSHPTTSSSSKLDGLEQDIQRRRRPARGLTLNEDNLHAPQTFEEFVPPSLITSPHTSPDDPPPKRRSTLKFASLRRSTISSMGTAPRTSAAGHSLKSEEGKTGKQGHERHRSDDLNHAKEKLRSTFRRSVHLSGVVQGLKQSVSSAVHRSSYHRRTTDGLAGYAEMDDDDGDGKVGLLRDRETSGHGGSGRRAH